MGHPKLSLYLLTKNRPGAGGFVLPLVMMVGLVIAIVGVVMLQQSRSDQIGALNQQFAAKSLSMAEVGVTRLQDLLNKNRYLAMFPDCVSGRNSSGVCQDSSAGAQKSWANVTNIPLLTVCGAAGNPSQVQSLASSQAWIPVNSADPNQGEYRLLTYQYTPTAGTAPGTGILTVEGRVNASSQTSNSLSRLEVKIPVEPGPILQDGVPGVWLQSGATGNNTIQGDVLINDCGTSLSGITVTGTDPDTGQPYAAKYTAMEFPDLPTGVTPANTLNNPSGTITLPRLSGTTIDTPNAQGIYEYAVNDINFQGGTNTLTITPGYKVRFYLQGSINVGSNSDIVHTCVGYTPTSGCKPTDFQIFGYGQPVVNGTNITRPKMCMSGNNMLEAFILAPEYTIGVAGTGGGVGGVKGTVWAYDWSNSGGCGSSTNNIVVVQQARWEDLGLEPKNTPPSLKNVASWSRQGQ
ncbi:MAG: hypothetical protein GC158_03165 [Cyanobacteria bacterium RI_101]|nr:hypothetical protein [Cyanobacteria bacterium RI_101]